MHTAADADYLIYNSSIDASGKKHRRSASKRKSDC